MDFFKTDILRKEFEQSQKEVLTDEIKCGLCEKTACEDFHRKFLVICKFCREKQCKACKEFNIAKDIFFKSLDNTGKRICFIRNSFIRYFLSLSSESLQENYHVTTETVCIQKKNCMM